MNDNYQPLTTEHTLFLSALAIFLFVCYMLRNTRLFSRVNNILIYILTFVTVAAVIGNIKDFFNSKK